MIKYSNFRDVVKKKGLRSNTASAQLLDDIASKILDKACDKAIAKRIAIIKPELIALALFEFKNEYLKKD